ncbi:hypothetical protein [Streptomyces sp. NPDC060001]|uniref:hypothetical protein n=1 Tax=Streptomyces sp. NPDC060001 TaxID=3347032 RepID=UPI0036BC744B
MSNHETSGEKPGTYVITPDQMMAAGSIFIPADQIQAVEIPRPPIVALHGEDGNVLVAVHPDGHLEYGPGYGPDEAARVFWEAVERFARPIGEQQWGAPLNARINAELAAGQRAEEALERVKQVGPDLEYEATMPGMAEAAREAKRDASRRIRQAIARVEGTTT